MLYSGRYGDWYGSWDWLPTIQITLLVFVVLYPQYDDADDADADWLYM